LIGVKRGFLGARQIAMQVPYSIVQRVFQIDYEVFKPTPEARMMFSPVSSASSSTTGLKFDRLMFLGYGGVNGAYPGTEL
jgi:hypothetical protein